jgi:hypothetical protein
MHITGEQLYFLIQVLKDSLDLQQGYDWPFTHKRETRKKFHEELIKTIITNENVSVKQLY